jgi:DMSO/TMAO reductase YedYZ molybdopterin-dependent catalytic subunit
MSSSDWSPPHSHDPNPGPPSVDPTFRLVIGAVAIVLGVDELRALPQTELPGCIIHSTGHPATGPFTFSGVALLALIDRYVNDEWATVDVLSADGFGARLTAEELRRETSRPALLAIARDRRPLDRAAGLVRLIVPSETDDALRQVKWIGEIQVW